MTEEKKGPTRVAIESMISALTASLKDADKFDSGKSDHAGTRVRNVMQADKVSAQACREHITAVRAERKK